MNNISLTYQEKSNLESRHKKTRDGRERDRIKAILLKNKGWTNRLIAQALFIHEDTVNRHLDDYYNKNEKLTLESGGSEGYLSKQQAQSLVQHLCDITYLHTHQIVAYIKETFNVEYTVSGLNKWLHQYGFSYKQPKGTPHKFDETKQADFINYYEKLKASLSDDEPLLFMDAVHPTQATKITAGWIKKGTDKAIETTGSRTRLNIIGAIRLNHLADTIVNKYKTINGESIIEFLNRTRDYYNSSSTIHIVLDGASYHGSDVVIKEAEKLNIKLHTLPAYSPNLNPIERLWKVMNKHARNNKYFATAKEFREQIDRFFSETLPDIADSLNSTINDNFQKLSSAAPAF